MTHDTKSRLRTACYLPTLEPGRLCPVGGETRCAEVMALNETWRLRFENVQPEWLNEFLSSFINPGIENIFPHFFGAVAGKSLARNGFKQRDKRQRHYAHRGYNESQTFIGIIKGWKLLSWCLYLQCAEHARLAGLKLALSLAGGSQTFDSNEEIVQLRLGEPQAGFAESHRKE